MSDAVSQHLRQLIFAGVLRPHQRVPQDEVASDLGVSRLPVREALINLQHEGLVYTVPRRGAFVAPLDDIDVQDHYEIYGLVHGLAAARTAQVAGEGTLAELRRLHEAMLDAADPVDFNDLNWQFHRLINVTGGSQRLKAVLATLARSLPRNFFEVVHGATRIATAGHTEILRAIEAGDGEAASLACQRHLRREGDLMLETMTANNFWGTRKAE